jgi:threonylcarbamoyladenosine tRNA methylthiotransferase MtaB
MKKNRPKISIATLGCKVNLCDSAAIYEVLKNNGCEIVPFSNRADIYIINTCVVTGKTESQSRQLIRRAIRTHPGCRVIVTGCYAQKSPGRLAGLSDRVHVLGNPEKKDVPLYVSKLLNGDTVPHTVSDIFSENKFTSPSCSHFFNRTRAFLKIQDGCNAGCTYCIVPSVRGPSRSLAADEVKKRLHLLVQAGYREVVLTGIHLGAYGLDLIPASNIAELLQSLEEDAHVPRVRLRLSSIEPKEFSDELIRIISQSKLVCPHFHIPLQSGDETILKRMRRPYTPSFFKRLLQRLAAEIPGLNIGIDVIAGFPGETDEQFQTTVSFIQNLPAGYLHVFPYSRREGTAAADFSGQVPEPVKKQRVQILRRLSLEKKSRFYSSCTNKDLSVLVEAKRDKETGFLKGFSRNYIPVLLEGSDDLIGKEKLVRVTEVKKDKVSGIVKA